VLIVYSLLIIKHKYLTG